MMLRIDEDTWNALCNELLRRRDVETAGLLLGETIVTPNGSVIAVRETVVLAGQAYRIRRSDQLSLDPVELNRHFRRAREQKWSIFTIHTHPASTKPWFSFADDSGDARLMPSLACQVPNVPHGSMVLAGNRKVIARVFDENGASRSIPIHVVGRTLSISTPANSTSESWFSRQVLALGKRGQSQLRGLRIGVIGLGGTGSLASLQLAHLGVGELVLIDGDIVEESNLSRIAGATKSDINETRKVDVAARYARSVGLVQNIECYPEYLTENLRPVVASCDLILSCVDRHSPRALLNRMAYQHLIPVIDVGTAFRVDETGALIGDSGRVVVVGPGRPCLACWGHLDPHALRIEALSLGDREDQVEAGYIDGAVVDQPSVVAFNATVAAAGIVEVIRIATAFGGAESPPVRIAFSFVEGTAKRNSVYINDQCAICGKLKTSNADLKSVNY